MCRWDWGSGDVIVGADREGACNGAVCKEGCTLGGIRSTEMYTDDVTQSPFSAEDKTAALCERKKFRYLLLNVPFFNVPYYQIKILHNFIPDGGTHLILDSCR